MISWTSENVIKTKSYYGKGNWDMRTERTRYWGSVPGRNRDISLLYSVHTRYALHTAFCLMSTGAQLPGREADHSCSAEVKKVCSCTIILQWLLTALCLIKPRDNFTFIAKVVNIWSEENEVTGGWRKLHNEENDQAKKDEMGRACSTKEGEQECI
jgi:hypothetical protein